MTDWAAKVLEGVPEDAFAKIVYEAMRFERRDETPEWVERGNSTAQTEARSAAAKIQADALAAIARMGAGDGLVERAEVALEAFAHPFRPTMGPAAAGKLIEDLAAHIAALTAERDIHAKKGQEWAEIAHAATDRGMRAEAERDALRERVARVEGALKLRDEIAALEKLCDHDCDNEDCMRCFHYPEILEQKRKQLAALTDGGKDG